MTWLCSSATRQLSTKQHLAGAVISKWVASITFIYLIKWWWWPILFEPAMNTKCHLTVVDTLFGIILEHYWDPYSWIQQELVSIKGRFDLVFATLTDTGQISDATRVFRTSTCGKLKTLVEKSIGEINYDSNERRSLLAKTKVLQLILVSKLLGYSKCKWLFELWFNRWIKPNWIVSYFP